MNIPFLLEPAAKDYLWGALASGLDLGHGSGPVNHLWRVLPVSTVTVV